MPVIRQFGLIMFFSLATMCFAYEPDDDDNTASPNTSSSNPGLIALNEDVQQLAGIQTVTTHLQHYRPEYTVYGKVLDITPLLILRQNYLAATTRFDSASAKYRLSQQSMSRLRNLHRHDVVSTRRLQEQQSQWQTDKAIADESSQQRRLIVADSFQLWGKTLTNWFTDPASTIADNIITHRSQLLQITLPPDRRLPEAVTRIRIAPDGNKQHSQTARLVAAAPQVDPLTQGRQYFFLLDNANQPAGLHLTAWVPKLSGSLEGVEIPRNALLWHLGQAYVFIKLNDEQFLQRPIKEYLESENGYFIADGIAPGETIVSSGAQMLLSHRLRGQIPDEDDDD